MDEEEEEKEGGGLGWDGVGWGAMGVVENGE